MDNIQDAMLLFIAGVNIAIIMLTGFLVGKKRSQKRAKKTSVFLLIINLIFDVVCLIAFIQHDMIADAVVFALFLPLMVYLLYEAVKDLVE